MATSVDDKGTGPPTQPAAPPPPPPSEPVLPGSTYLVVDASAVQAFLSNRMVKRALFWFIMAAFGASMWYFSDLMIKALIPIGHIFTVLSLSFIIYAALDGPATKLERVGIPRSVTALVFWGVLGFAVVYVIFLVVPMVTQQVDDLQIELPKHYGDFMQAYGNLPPHLTDWLNKEYVIWVPKVEAMAGDVAIRAGAMLGNTVFLLLDVVMIMLLSTMLLCDPKRLGRFVSGWTSDQERKRELKEVVDSIVRDLGRWAFAQICMATWYGFGLGLLLKIMGVHYALTIGLFAGLSEAMIPFIGGCLALMLAYLVMVPMVLGSHLSMFGGVVGMDLGVVGAMIFLFVGYLVVEEMENHVLQPLLMDKYLHIPSVWVMVGLFVGCEIFGILGALLTLPMMVIYGHIRHQVHPYVPDEDEEEELQRKLEAPTHHRLLFWRNWFHEKRIHMHHA